MNNITTGIALLAIIAVLAAYLISRSKSVERVTRAAKDREDAAQAERDEAERRRMVHQADLEIKRQENQAFRGLGVTPHDIYEINGQLHEGPLKFANMEPFCGEGEKP